MAEKLTWSIIKFPDDNDAVEAVPSRWLTGNICKWPPYPPNSKKLTEAIEKSLIPNEAWQEFHIIPFRNNVYDDYATAKKKVKKALATSDLDESDSAALPGKRKIKFRKTYSYSSVEEEDFTLPAPPLEPLSIYESIDNEDQSPRKNDSSQSVGKKGTLKETSLICNNNNNKNTVTNVQQSIRFENSVETTVHTSEPPNKTNKNEIGIKDIYNLLLRLTRKHELLQLVVSDIKESLNNIESTLSRNQIDVELDAVESISVKFNLPIDDNEKLQEFEAYLKDNEKAFKKAVHEISLLGGRHLYDFIYRAGKILITNGFASGFSYLGKRQKDSFKILMLNKLLTESAMQLHKQVTIKDVEVEIAKWLKRAAERAKKEPKQ